MLDKEAQEKPSLLTQFKEEEDQEFKQVLKKLVNKESLQKMEEDILEKRRKLAASRGWKRGSGVRIAPLKILTTGEVC